MPAAQLNPSGARLDPDFAQLLNAAGVAPQPGSFVNALRAADQAQRGSAPPASASPRSPFLAALAKAPPPPADPYASIDALFAGVGNGNTGAPAAGKLDPDFQHLLARPADPNASIDALFAGAEKSADTGADRTDDWLRRIALGGRDIGEGVFDTLAAPHDLSDAITNLARRGINRAFGTHMPMVTPWGSQLSSALTAAGAPVPTTPGEKTAAALTRGTAGALTGAGILGLGASAFTTVPNLVRAGAAGATSAGASEGARRLGLGSVGQFIAGLAGGLTPAALEGIPRLAAGGAANLVRNLVRPLTRSGQEQMGANILARQATSPSAAAARLTAAQDVVPGSARTAGEASGDPGLLALEKGIRGRNPGPFGERVSQQNAARQQELGALGGTPADITAAQRAREATTTPMREDALGSGRTADVRPVLLSIDRILGSPAGQRDVPRQALTWLKDKLSAPDDVSDRFMTPSQVAKLSRGTFEPRDPANLYAIRQDISDALAGKLGGEQSKFRLARSQLMAVRDTLDNAIEDAAPGFKAYLDRYRTMSVPIDQMKAMQEIQRRASSGLDVTNGQPWLGASRFNAALDRAIEKNAAQFTPDQAARLRAIRTDLHLGQAPSSPLVKAPGSDTFQNLSVAQVLGGGMTDMHPALRVLAKPLSWVYHLAGSDDRVNDILADAMLHPKVASQLLQRATPSNIRSFSDFMRAATRTALPSGTVPYRSLPLIASQAPPQLPKAQIPTPAQRSPAFLAAMSPDRRLRASMSAPTTAPSNTSAPQGVVRPQTVTAIRGLSGAVHVRHRGRSATILLPTYPGASPQIVHGLLNMQ